MTEYIDTLWFSSYLNKRFQQTHYTGAISDKKEVISGVPQCSVFGPILFLMYVNDLPLSRTSTCADIFADDTTIGTSSHFVETLTTDLQNVLSWCNSNNMSLNDSQTKLMYISSRHKQQILANCDHVIVKYKLALLKNLLVSQLVILSAGMLTLITLLKSVIPIYSYCQE